MNFSSLITLASIVFFHSYDPTCISGMNIFPETNPDIGPQIPLLGGKGGGGGEIGSKVFN